MATKKLKTIYIKDLDNTYEIMVDESQIEDGAVTEDKIADGSVTKDKLGTDVLEDLTQLYNNAITNTASGAIASFTDGADDMPMESLVCHIEPYQEGSGDHSPTNVRPISGYIGLDAYVRGFNLWDEEWEVGAINTSNGQNAAVATTIRSKNYIPCIPSTTYYKLALQNVLIFYYDANKTYLSFGTWGKNVTFTTPSDCRYLRFYVYPSYGTTYNHDICINISDTAKNGQYEPYNGATYSADWTDEAGTVYGGTLDVVNGLLTVDRAIMDLGTLTFGKSSIVTNGFVAVDGIPSDFPLAPSSITVPDWLCTRYVVTSNAGIEASGVDYAITWRISGNNKGVIIKDSTYSQYYTDNDMTAFKTAMNGVMLCYKIATPQTYRLTPTEVKTLLGQNNVWHNCNGDTDATYKADTKLYIDNKFAELQALILEN